MKKDNKQIPILDGAKLDEFHFGNVQWRFSNQNHLFHINRLEDIRSRLSFPLPPHRKTVYDLIFLTNGKSVRSKGLNQYKFYKHQLFFLPALQITAHESMSEDVQGYFIHFYPEFFSQARQLLRSYSFLEFNAPPIVTIPKEEVDAVLNIMERLLDLYENDFPKESKLIEWYLMTLFSEANRYVEQIKLPTKNTAATLTQQYKDKLAQHIYTHHTVKQYAQMLHVTPNHLNKCVRKTHHQTAQSLLNEMLIMEAKSLLKYSDLSISEIAEKLRGSNPSNFSRFFKKQTGCTPRDYISQ